jgi:hypothetical protein
MDSNSWLESLSAQQKQNQQDNQNQSKPAAWIIPPGPAVRPGGQRTYEQQKQKDKKNDS